jgi:hypothetical protein
MTRALVASDNFDSYTNADNLGDKANWLELNNSTGLLRVHKPAGDASIYEAFQARSECRWDGAETFADDQYSMGTLDNITVGAEPTRYIGVAVRMSPDTLTGRDYYAVRVYDGLSAAATKTEVVKFVNNTETVIYAAATGDDWASADTVEIEAITNGADVDLKIYQNGVLLRTVTDNSGTRLTSGKPGIVGLGASAAADAPWLDSWEGGDVTGADATAPVLSSPTATTTGTTTATGTVSTDEGNGTLYWYVSANASESSGTIQTGSSQAVSGTGVQNVVVTGQTAGTTRRIHYVHVDAATNVSNVVSSSTFTLAPPLLGQACL